jgi:hypothetical protein
MSSLPSSSPSLGGLSQHLDVSAALLRREPNPDRIGEWQSRGGRIARDAEGQSRPELRSRGLVARGSLQLRALISGPGNSVVAVLNPMLIGNAAILRSAARSTSGWSVAVIGNAERRPIGPVDRLRPLDLVWRAGGMSRPFPRAWTRVLCMWLCGQSCAACPKILPR